MAGEASLTVRPLVAADVDRYVELVRAVDATSGVDGNPHSHPYSKSEPRDAVAARERELTRWATPITEPGWRRAWGLFDGDDLVGEVYLAGGALRSELHRVSLGTGVARSHRGRGGGTMLLQAALAWAREQPEITWVDLGVFSDNPRAKVLYARLGFQVVGDTPDRFRIDGVSVGDTAMTFNVGDAEPAS